jgi:glycosyltransferase involved in cell wall biosynthesis
MGNDSSLLGRINFKKMHLILLTHPASLGSESMPRFAGMIMRGMTARGHEVEVWTSPQKLGRLPIRSAFIRKWLGYMDQFLIYPGQLRKLVNQQPDDTLFVVADQALGMWVPHLADRPHVIHCHDFLALRSALGEFPENPTRWTGRQYQRMIQKGFFNGKAFVSVSEKTREDLHHFLPGVPKISEVVHNGLNYSFRPMVTAERIPLLKKTDMEVPERGFILHVGGNQWYKNRKGTLEIYRAYVTTCPNPASLWMIGTPPTKELINLAASIPAPGKIQFLSGLTNEQINAAYSHARVLLFPSLEEGFGWPIAEAMASGCPVITTDAAPMNEVAGSAARLIPRMPAHYDGLKAWAQSAAGNFEKVFNLSDNDRAALIEQGFQNAKRFDTKKALDAYGRIYEQTLIAS